MQTERACDYKSNMYHIFKQVSTHFYLCTNNSHPRCCSTIIVRGNGRGRKNNDQNCVQGSTISKHLANVNHAVWKCSIGKHGEYLFSLQLGACILLLLWFGCANLCSWIYAIGASFVLLLWFVQGEIYTHGSNAKTRNMSAMCTMSCMQYSVASARSEKSILACMRTMQMDICIHIGCKFKERINWHVS